MAICWALFQDESLFRKFHQPAPLHTMSEEPNQLMGLQQLEPDPLPAFELAQAEEGMNEIETFYGLIETTADALKVIELCRQGKLGRVRRRLHERERKMIRSGSVFVFDETESGVKRWTDGRLWSPSRILGNFLIYRELERKSLDKNGAADNGAVEQLLEEKEREDVDVLMARLRQQPPVEEHFNLESFKGADDIEGLLPWLSDPIINTNQVCHAYIHSNAQLNRIFVTLTAAWRKIWSS